MFEFLNDLTQTEQALLCICFLLGLIALAK